MQDESQSRVRAQAPEARVLLVEDHPVIRRMLAEIIDSAEGLTVCGTAKRVRSALEQIQQQHPDLVVLDISLEEGDCGLDVLRMLHDDEEQRDDPRVLVVSSRDPAIYVPMALKEGADGYLDKCEAGDELVPALQRVLHGERFVGPGAERRTCSDTAEEIRRPGTGEGRMGRVN